MVRMGRGLLLLISVGPWLLPAAARMPPGVKVAAGLALIVYVTDELLHRRTSPPAPSLQQRHRSPAAAGRMCWFIAAADGLVAGLLTGARFEAVLLGGGQWTSGLAPSLGLAAALWLSAAGELIWLRPAAVTGLCAVVAALVAGTPWPTAALLPLASLAGYSLARRFGRIRDHLSAELCHSRALVQSRDQLLTTLAHEVRTPLTIMQATEGVLLDESPGPLNKRQRRFLEAIHGNTQRLIHFSENMLASIKVDRGWTPDQTQRIDLRRITRQVVETMQPLLDQRQQQIHYTFPSMLAAPRADETWIRQVLLNLIHNASKYTGDTGMIVISVTQDDQWVVVTVSDNGAGLAGSARDALFEEFYQERPYSSTGQEGSGLGLAIVRSVIERHGGKVYVGTAQGLGTMVSFTLPLEEG